MDRTTVRRAFSAMTWSGLLAAGVLAQANPAGIPGNATALEGVPTIKVETGEDATRRRTLTKAEATAETLAIRVVDGRYYWASRGNRPLTLTAAGEMTYLSSTEPGQYVRLRKIKNKLYYVEHLDMGPQSIIYSGELRIVLGE